MQAALVGDYRAEHLFVLSQSLQAYRFHQARIEECDRQIEPLLEKLAQQVGAAWAQLKPLKGAQQQETLPVPRNEPKTGTSASSPLNKAKRKHKPIANEPKIELAGLLERICGRTQVVGLNVLSVLLIVSEIGIDMCKWRSAKAFCSWLGLCSGNKNQRRQSTRLAHPPSRQSSGRRFTTGRSIGGPYRDLLGIFYRRKQAHLGATKATTATARKLACLIYHLLKYKQPYQKLDPAIYELRLQKSALLRLQNQATTLGYKLVPTAPVPA